MSLYECYNIPPTSLNPHKNFLSLYDVELLCVPVPNLQVWLQEQPQAGAGCQTQAGPTGGHSLPRHPLDRE